MIPRQLSDLKVAFLRELYNESFSPVTWESLFVRNGLERVSQDTGSLLRSAFNSSARMESTPVAFPLSIALMAFLTSSSV